MFSLTSCRQVKSKNDNIFNVIERIGNCDTINLTVTEAYCMLRIAVTPKDQDSREGKTVFSEPILITPGCAVSKHKSKIVGAPAATSVAFSSMEPLHTTLIRVTTQYKGGIEGKSLYQWCRIKGGQETPISGLSVLSIILTCRPEIYSVSVQH